MADEQPAPAESEFRSALKELLNKHSIEGGSNTPDHVLADYLIRCLDNFTETTQTREKWYGVALVPGQPMRNEVNSDNLRNTGPMGSTTP